MACLFCKEGLSFKTVEHIIPESMGNDDLILRGQICDKCQNYLSQNEQYILSKTPMGYWRVILGIKTKKGRLPKADFTKPEDARGAISDCHPAHDNFTIEALPDYTIEIMPSKDIEIHFDNTGGATFKYVFTPMVLYEMGRFLGKIGLALICLKDAQRAYSGQFDDIRQYVRRGSINDHWPIFHATHGEIKDLFEYVIEGNSVKEDIVCYSYRLLTVEKYTLFNLIVGSDSWVICLNDRFPTPVIISGFPRQELILLWNPNPKNSKG
jgi:hypothetical protein